MLQLYTKIPLQHIILFKCDVAAQIQQAYNILNIVIGRDCD